MIGYYGDVYWRLEVSKYLKAFFYSDNAFR